MEQSGKTAILPYVSALPSKCRQASKRTLVQSGLSLPLKVRSAVRALTLNVYSIEDEKVQSFVCSKPHSSYFQELAVSIVDQCQACHPSSPASTRPAPPPPPHLCLCLLHTWRHEQSELADQVGGVPDVWRLHRCW